MRCNVLSWLLFLIEVGICRPSLVESLSRMPLLLWHFGYFASFFNSEPSKICNIFYLIFVLFQQSYRIKTSIYFQWRSQEIPHGGFLHFWKLDWLDVKPRTYFGDTYDHINGPDAFSRPFWFWRSSSEYSIQENRHTSTSIILFCRFPITQMKIATKDVLRQGLI